MSLLKLYNLCESAQKVSFEQIAKNVYGMQDSRIRRNGLQKLLLAPASNFEWTKGQSSCGEDGDGNIEYCFLYYGRNIKTTPTQKLSDVLILDQDDDVFVYHELSPNNKPWCDNEGYAMPDSMAGAFSYLQSSAVKKEPLSGEEVDDSTLYER